MRRIILLVIFLAVLLFFGWLFATIPTETIVSVVGVERAPLIMFLLGMIGGLSTFTGIPYHLVLMGLAAGGATPWLLGITTALGVMVGDSTTFLFSRQAKQTLSGRLQAWLTAVSTAIGTRPRLLTPALVLYGSLSPFSNDFIVASLTLMGYTYRRIIVPLTIGNIFYNVTLAYLGYYYYDIIIGWFS